MDEDPSFIRVPIEDRLDLHPFAPRDVADVVSEYIDAAARRGFRIVRLIHGRGIGVQRAAVHRTLARHPRVLRFWDAPDAHLGATLAELADPGTDI
jgi:DNA-nicking Smr family endonuclease